MEIALSVAVLAVVCVGLLRGGAWRTALAVAACAALGAFLARPVPDDLARQPPAPVEDEGFVTSDTCQACHPEQYGSWSDSYHRRMTQPATPANVLAPFDGLRLGSRGQHYDLMRGRVKETQAADD